MCAGRRLVRGALVLLAGGALAQEEGARIAIDQGDGTMCAGDYCFPKPPTPYVSALSPAAGPLDGGTDPCSKQGPTAGPSGFGQLTDRGWPKPGAAMTLHLPLRVLSFAEVSAASFPTY